MFSNILRTQARLALTSCRTHVPVFSVSRIAPRLSSLPTVLPALRAISTSRPVWANNGPLTASAESSTLYIGNVPYNLTEEEIRAKFEPFGELKDVRLGYHPDGRSRGFGHVEFAELDDAVTAYTSFKEEPLYMLDRDIRIDYAVGRRASPSPSLTLYFQFQGTLDTLREATTEFQASITDMFFLKNRDTGEDTGAGFINFNTVARAQEALSKLDGSTYGENVLQLRFASPRRERQNRRGRN